MKKIIQEVEPTFLRLAKIFWSQVWRFLLIGVIIAEVLTPIMLIISAYVTIKFNLPDIEGSIQSNPLSAVLISLPISFIIFYFMFRLVIGLKYADFTFDFSPQRDRKKPGYVSLIFQVSWAYFWRIIPFTLISDIIKFNILHLVPTQKESYIYDSLSILIFVLIGIFFLRFVVNKQYGDVRLSLLSLDKKEEKQGKSSVR